MSRWTLLIPTSFKETIIQASRIVHVSFELSRDHERNAPVFIEACTKNRSHVCIKAQLTLLMVKHPWFQTIHPSSQSWMVSLLSSNAFFSWWHLILFIKRIMKEYTDIFFFLSLTQFFPLNLLFLFTISHQQTCLLKCSKLIKRCFGHHYIVVRRAISGLLLTFPLYFSSFSFS